MPEIIDVSVNVSRSEDENKDYYHKCRTVNLTLDHSTHQVQSIPVQKNITDDGANNSIQGSRSSSFDSTRLAYNAENIRCYSRKQIDN